MKIKLTRKIQGKELVNELEKKYGSINELENRYKNNMDDLKLYSDLEDWKYYSQNPEEVLEDGKTIVSDELVLGDLEMDLLDKIKTEKPQSVNELTEMADSDIRIIYPRVQQLANMGVIELTPGSQKAMVPVMKYDTWEIS